MLEAQIARAGWNDALDGLRGSAFLLVLMAHFSNSYDGPFRGLGKPGVWIFFALSAFLLTRNLLADLQSKPVPFALKNYAFRRFMRIVPLYYLTVLIYLLFEYVVRSTNFIDHLLFQLGEGHLWTIVAEIKFYGILPILLAGHLLIKHHDDRLVLLYWGCLWLISLLMFPASNYEISAISIFPYLNVFLAGAFAAVLVARVNVPPFIAAVVASIGIAVIVVTTPSLWSVVIEKVPYDHFYRDQAIFGVVATGLLIGALRWRAFADLLAISPLRLMGRVSYSGYLIHPLALRLTSNLADVYGKPVALVLSLAATAAGTLLLYIVVERPLSKLRLNTSIGMASEKAVL